MPHPAVQLTLLLLTLSAAPAAAGIPAAGIPIVGRILGPGGEPRPQAEIRLEPIPPTYERAVLRLEGRPGPDAAATTRSGADGAFELTAPDAGMWKVVVSTPGMLTMERRLIPLVEAAVLPPVELTPAADLEVRLVDAEGKPRPGWVGAVTKLLRDEAWRPQLRLAAAGEDGVARLPLGRGEKIQLEVLADGHPLDVYELYDETSVTITAPPGVAGTVRVVDRRRRPLARAVAFQGSALLPLGLSDGEGRLPLVLQAEKPKPVQVSAADRANGSFDLDLAAAGGEVKDLRLDPPATVHGRVLDETSRDPLAGALVWAVRGELAVTDGQGRYALDLGIYKSRWVKAAAPGYLKGQSQLRDASGEAAVIGLAPAAALSGRVVDRQGGRLAGVEIELGMLRGGDIMSAAAQRFLRDGWRGRTSSRGAFRVVGVPAGVGFELKLRREGFAPRTLGVAPLSPLESRSGIEVVLEPGRVAFGRVVDGDEIPIAGAEVALETPPPADMMSATRRIRRFDDDAHDDPAYLTDAEGRFEIVDLAPGRYDLAVRAAGFARALVPGVRVAEDGGRVDFGTVVMAPGAAIEGRVADSDGRAIAGADVSVDLASRASIGGSRPDLQQGRAKTDAQGRFVVADLLAGQPVTLTVTREGYGSYTTPDLRPPTEEPLAIVLQAAGRLEGKVVDSRGNPIPGANVSAHPDYRVRTARTMAQRRLQTPWARTGADGRFQMADVEPGTLQVAVDAEGYQQQILTGIEIAAGGVRQLELVLEVGAVVEGTVTTAAGEPSVQASITVVERLDGLTRGNLVSAGGQTDVEGRYRVTGAPTGPAMITVVHAKSRRLEKHVELRPGTTVVDLVLEGGFAIRGRVVAPDGTPVGGAVVSIQEMAQAERIHFSQGAPEEVSAADGSFSLEGLAAGTYSVAASREGWAPASRKQVEVTGDVGALLLELRRGVTLKGRVLGLELDELGSLALVAYGEGGMRQGRIDFAGEYAFDHLAPGQWYLQAQVAGSGRSAMLQIELPEGAGEVERDIELGTGFTLTGIVIDGGEPAAGVDVAAISATGTSGNATTGADGRFRIDDLKAGSLQVMVMSGVGMQHVESLELAGDRELRIEIATGSVSGVVRDAADGEPLDGASVALEPLAIDGDSMWSRLMSRGNQTVADSRGRFQFPRVQGGTWRVVATRSGYAPGEATAAVAGGAAPEVEIRLTPTEGVSFAVALESGAPLQVVQLALLDPSGRRIAAGAYPVVDSRVRVSIVPPGRWDLMVQAGDSAATRFTVTSPGDQGRLLLPDGGTLHLRVPELEGVLMAPVELQGPDGRPFVSGAGFAGGPGEWVMSGGQAMIPALAPGVWTFTVRHEGRTWTGQATVTPGATTEVSLD